MLAGSNEKPRSDWLSRKGNRPRQLRFDLPIHDAGKHKCMRMVIEIKFT